MQGFFGALSRHDSGRRSTEAGWIRVCLLVAVALLTTLFPSGLALADGTLDIQVATWNANTSTGVVTYDVALNDVCSTYTCEWKIEAFRIDGTSERRQATLGTGTVFGSSSSPLSYSRTVSGTSSREITHVRATVTPSTGSPRTLTKWVHDLYPDGGIDLDVHSWQRNVNTGAVSYDLTMTWEGAGQYEGPCDGYCEWRVEAFNIKDGVERSQGYIGSGTNTAGRAWTSSQRYTGTSDREITHVRAWVKPYGLVSPTRTYTTTVPVSDLYPDGSVSLKVVRWDRDASTGVISYDLNLSWIGGGQVRGPCDGYCTWKIEALNIVNGVETSQGILMLDSSFAARTWSHSRSAVGTINKPITHLRATLAPHASPSPNETYRTTVPVDASLGQGAELQVASWNRDTETGEVSYDVSFSIKDGAVDPACATTCSWKVEAYYANGDVEKLQLSLGSGTLNGPLAVYGTRFTGTNLNPGEITELRASVTPTGAPEPQYTDVVQVSEPYPDGEIDIRWSNISETEVPGEFDYDILLSISRAAQVGGPCENTCTWEVVLVDGDGVTTTAHQGTLVDSTWSYQTSLSGSLDASVVGAIATVAPASGLGDQYSDDIGILHQVTEGANLALYAAALEPAFGSQLSEFCNVLLLKAGISTDGDSVPDAYQKCMALIATGGITIWAFVDQMSKASGGLQGLKDLAEEWAEGDEEVPSPTEQQRPDPIIPDIPEGSTEYDDCEQGVPVITTRARTHINKRHRYNAGKGASEFREKLDWEWLVEKDAPRVLNRRSLSYPDQCERIVDFGRFVGYEKHLSNGEWLYRRTTIYTVATEQDGTLLTAHPGKPIGQQDP